MMCQWSVYCQDEAVGYQVHPMMGRLPICQECSKGSRDDAIKESLYLWAEYLLRDDAIVLVNKQGEPYVAQVKG